MRTLLRDFAVDRVSVEALLLFLRISNRFRMGGITRISVLSSVNGGTSARGQY